MDISCHVETILAASAVGWVFGPDSASKAGNSDGRLTLLLVGVVYIYAFLVFRLLV